MEKYMKNALQNVMENVLDNMMKIVMVNKKEKLIEECDEELNKTICDIDYMIQNIGWKIYDWKWYWEHDRDFNGKYDGLFNEERDNKHIIENVMKNRK